jgi:thiosulfate dehydrogenase
MKVQFQEEPEWVRRCQHVVVIVLLCLALLVALPCFYFLKDFRSDPRREIVAGMVAEPRPGNNLWRAPDSTLIPQTPYGDLIRYGRELIVHTAKYLGPNGKVKALSNGLNCQNCHLKAGTKPFANNFAAVASGYPKFRARSGGIETIEKRINDCFERSLNGQPPELNSVEMQAMIAYFSWVGKDVKKGFVPDGTRIDALPFMDRAADPLKGKKIFEKHCLVCHGEAGAGFRHPDSLEWTYPPLAGPDSYGTGAGMHRLSQFASYVKNNMPYGTTYENPVLTDEEAWDVAAYVNSLPRPVQSFPGEWPDISDKPFDHPFGPYADSFSETQHKYGPFGMIRAVKR